MKNRTLQEVYKNSSEELQEILKSKFNPTDLGLEINKGDFKEYFLELINSYTSIEFIDQRTNISSLPTKRYQLLDENNRCLFEIDLNPNMMYFWCSYNRIYKKLLTKFGDNYKEINGLITDILYETLELKGLKFNSF